MFPSSAFGSTRILAAPPSPFASLTFSSSPFIFVFSFVFSFFSPFPLRLVVAAASSPTAASASRFQSKRAMLRPW
jgi:hypothetical protein